MWDIVWVSPHRSVSVSRHFLLQAPQCPCSVRKWFSRDHCCRGMSKPGCRIVGSHTRWELTTWADFQSCLHRLLMSTGCKSSHNGFLDVSDSHWPRLILESQTTDHCLPQSHRPLFTPESQTAVYPRVTDRCLPQSHRPLFTPESQTAVYPRVTDHCLPQSHRPLFTPESQTAVSLWYTVIHVDMPQQKQISLFANSCSSYLYSPQGATRKQENKTGFNGWQVLDRRQLTAVTLQ